MGWGLIVIILTLTAGIIWGRPFINKRTKVLPFAFNRQKQVLLLNEHNEAEVSKRYTNQTPDGDALEDQLEALVADRRRARPDQSAGFCTKCGQPIRKNDLFCSRCGAKVASE